MGFFHRRAAASDDAPPSTKKRRIFFFGRGRARRSTQGEQASHIPGAAAEKESKDSDHKEAPAGEAAAEREEPLFLRTSSYIEAQDELLVSNAERPAELNSASCLNVISYETLLLCTGMVDHGDDASRFVLSALEAMREALSITHEQRDDILRELRAGLSVAWRRSVGSPERVRACCSAGSFRRFLSWLPPCSP
jgi:hypothetical protein